MKKTNLLLAALFAACGFAAPTRAAEDAAAPAAAPPSVQPPRSIYDKAFDDTFKKATEGWLEDPLKHIDGDMLHCSKQLAALKTDQPVQQVQARAVTRLDAVIKLLEKQCSGGGGSNPNPTKPLEKSIIAKGPGGQGDMHDPKAGEKQWASLPAKQREQILQSRTQGFPPGFEAILQSYYERLAQEQAGDEASAATTPAAGPSNQGVQ
jgi:hypothetical protein